MVIEDVKTIYTGGGIYEYIVKLDGGRWAMFDDERLAGGFVPIVDREPTESDWRAEFFEVHDAGYLQDDVARAFMAEVLQESDLWGFELDKRIRQVQES